MLKEILRFVTAIVFIASGFVKAADAVGFSFKLEEYFSPAVFNMPFLEKLALPIAVIVVALELVLGLMLLLKIRLKFAIGALVALCVFFGFLTFYSAYFNVVTDCGCFGDAIKFTPWESFWKDIILLVALIILWFLYKNVRRKNRHWEKTSSTIFAITSLIFAGIIVYGIVQEPMIDFRDYKVGTDMNAEMDKIAMQPSEYKTYYSLKNKNTGEILEIDQDNYVEKREYWEPGSPWEIQQDKTTSKMVKQGYTSELIKFSINETNGNNITQKILDAPKAVIVFSYAPDKANTEILAETELKASQIKDTLVVGVSTKPGTFSKITDATMDGTAIKTIARSNPFVLTLQNGKITGKVPGKNFAN